MALITSLDAHRYAAGQWFVVRVTLDPETGLYSYRYYSSMGHETKSPPRFMTVTKALRAVDKQLDKIDDAYSRADSRTLRSA